MVKMTGLVKRVFSVELCSGSDLRNLSLPSESQHLQMEGTIGSLRRADFIEDSVLEIVGTRGVLRIDLTPDDLPKRFLRPQMSETREES